MHVFLTQPPPANCRPRTSFSPASSSERRVSSSTGRMSPFVHDRRRRLHCDARSGCERIPNLERRGQNPCRYVRVCDQRLQLPPLAGAGARLCRGLPGRGRRASRAQLQTCAGSPLRWPTAVFPASTTPDRRTAGRDAEPSPLPPHPAAQPYPPRSSGAAEGADGERRRVGLGHELRARLEQW